MAKRFLVSAVLIAVIFVALTGCGNHPPQIVSVTASPSTVAPGEEATLTCNANDADGNQLSYEWESVDEDTTYIEASFIWPAPEETGDYRFYVTVTDGLGGVAYDSTLIVPVGYAAIPAVKLLLPLEEDVGTREVTLVWNRSDYPTWYEYKLYRSDEQANARENGKVIASIGYDQGKTRNDTIFLDKGLDPGTDYYYVVATVDSSDNMAFSNEIKVTTESFYHRGSQSLGGGHGVRLVNTGNYIFCAARERGVYGFTISPAGPVPGSVIPQPNNSLTAYAYDLAISGSLLHVAFGTEGYVLYGITNPQAPDSLYLVDTAALGGEARAIYAEGSDIFIGTTTPAGLHILHWYNVPPPIGPPVLIDTALLHDVPTDIYVSGNYVYVAVQHSGLETVNWSQGTGTITYANLTSTNDAANRVYVHGSYAYVAISSEGLLVVDLSSPGNPVISGSWKDEDRGNDAQGIFCSFERGYLADGTYGLRVLNLRDPFNPTLIGTKEVGNDLKDVWVKSEGDVTQAILADWFNAIHMIEW